MTVEVISEVLEKYRIRSVNPKIAAFGLLGMLNWTYQWYKPNGAITSDAIVKTFTEIFLNGIGVPVTQRRKSG